MDAHDWDDRYAAAELVWGVEPNRFVAEELGPLPAGRALDVACGEGRNALWLASRGWHAVGVDFSPVAVERGRRLAEEAGLHHRVDLRVADAVAGPLPDGPFDAVVVAYLHLPADQRRAVLRKAGERLAPGGTLLVVAHDSSNLTDGTGGPQDPAVLYAPSDVVSDLADLPGLEVVRAEVVTRPVQTAEGERLARDLLARVRRVE